MKATTEMSVRELAAALKDMDEDAIKAALAAELAAGADQTRATAIAAIRKEAEAKGIELPADAATNATGAGDDATGDLADRVKALEAKVADLEGQLKGALEAYAATAEKVDKAADNMIAAADAITPAAASGDVRAELLKAFRQIETIAHHINVRLPG